MGNIEPKKHPSPQDLDAYQRGELPPDALSKIKKHLSGCQLCQKALNSKSPEPPVLAPNKESPPTLPPEVINGPLDKTRVGFRSESNSPADTSAYENQTHLGAELGKKSAAPVALAESPRADMNVLHPPQAPGEIGRFGSYRVLSLLGCGGMGMVYHAEDLVLRRPVALKIVRPELQGQVEIGHRMLREARAMAAIKHENLITVYQAGQEGSEFFMAMELLEGELLEERIKRESPLEVPEIVRLGVEIASGLAAIHKHNLIHRDIKPSNIWLEAPNGRVRILDFGLARAAAMSSGSHLTQMGTVVGTPAFMSPEQARSDEIDARSDLFSFGCVLYSLCTGAIPFRGDSLMAQLTSLAVDDPRPVHLMNPKIPPGLSELVSKLLEKKPDARPLSAAAVVLQLKLIGDIGINSESSFGVRAGSEGSGGSSESIPYPQTALRPPTLPPARLPEPLREKRASLPPPPDGNQWQNVALIVLALMAFCVVVIAAVMYWPRTPTASAPADPALNHNAVPNSALTISSNKAPRDPFDDGPPRDTQPREPRGDPRDFRDGPPPRDGQRNGPPPRDFFDGPPQLPPDLETMKPLARNDVLALLKSHNENSARPDGVFALDLKTTEMKDLYFPAASGKTGLPNPHAPRDVFSDFGIEGERSPHGIGMHAGPDEPAFVRITLGKQYTRFHAIVAQNQGLPRAEAAMAFAVYGDGKLLWKSKAVYASGESQLCNVSVKDVNVLRLEEACYGEPRAAHGIWFEPYLEK